MSDMNKAKVVMHGGNILATAKRLGCKTTDLIDMSSNLTPLGVVPGLHEILIEKLDEIRYLPETGSDSLTAAFAAKNNVQQAQVSAGNGTTEFIYAVPEQLDVQRALIVNPTYGDYLPASHWAGLAVDNYVMLAEEDFAFQPKKLDALLQGNEIVFLCNPNNPTGGFIHSELLHEFAKDHPKSYFLIDESYLPFVRGESLLHYPSLDNLYVLSSFSKVYGIPGLRLGFLTSTVANMKKVAAFRKPWGVNRMAQVAGEFLLLHGDGYVEDVVSYVEKQRPKLVAALAELPGVHVVPGQANFILSRLHGGMPADELAEKMLARRIMIRNCANFESLDNSFFRISLKNEAENDYCVKTLQEILGVHA